MVGAVHFGLTLTLALSRRRGDELSPKNFLKNKKLLRNVTISPNNLKFFINMPIYILQKKTQNIPKRENDGGIMSVNVNSISDSYNAWYNYKYGGNTRGITSAEFSDIVTRWKSNLNSWESQAAQDENKYEITDEDYSKSKSNGKDSARMKTGYKSNKTGMIVRGSVDAAAGLAGALANSVGKKVAEKATEKIAGKLIGKKATEKIAEKAAKKVLTQKLGEEVEKKAIKEASKKIAGDVTNNLAGAMQDDVINATAGKLTGTATKEATKEATKASNNAKGGKVWLITAPLSMAMGILYQTNKPNKDEHNAAGELESTILPDAQGELVDAEDQMESATESVMDLTEEANALQEDAADEIEENKTQFDMFNTSLTALKEKANSGEKLTESEKELYKELIPSMKEASDNISGVEEDAIDGVDDIHGDIEGYQSDFDSAADTIANVQGITDYAASFDSTAEVMCYVEGVGQALNAASGAKAAVDAGRFAASGGIFTAWAWAFAAMGTAGAVTSGLGAYEQYNWANDIGREVDLRKMTQDMGSETLDSYNEQIDMYDDNLGIVEDLEIEIPDDLEIPEETDPNNLVVANGTENGNNPNNSVLVNGAGNSSDPNNKDPNKKDENVI